MNERFFDELFTTNQLMVILRGQPPKEAVELANRAWDLGITAVEVPVHVPEALDALRAVVVAGRKRSMLVGAGTVVTLDQVQAVRGVGAAYTVAPGWNIAVSRASVAAGLPHLPGIATASEIQEALAENRTWLKAFPASSLGTDWFRAIRGPFPNVRLVATGGIDVHNIKDFISAGAAAVGIGSALNDPANIDFFATFARTTSPD